MGATAALDALGNEARRAIVVRLASGPKAVGQIALHLPISRPAVSRHLKVLASAGLVSADAHGREHLYRLQSAGFDAVRGWLEALWDEALPRFALLAENTAPNKAPKP